MMIQKIGPYGVGVSHEFITKRDPRMVRALVKSIRHGGETLPLITVRARGGMLGYDLVDGLHALMAAKTLKLPSIRAIVISAENENKSPD